MVDGKENYIVLWMRVLQSLCSVPPPPPLALYFLSFYQIGQKCDCDTTLLSGKLHDNWFQFKFRGNEEMEKREMNFPTAVFVVRIQFRSVISS